jgi:hypothetical protein
LGLRPGDDKQVGQSREGRRITQDYVPGYFQTSLLD